MRAWPTPGPARHRRSVDPIKVSAPHCEPGTDRRFCDWMTRDCHRAGRELPWSARILSLAQASKEDNDAREINPTAPRRHEGEPGRIQGDVGAADLCRRLRARAAADRACQNPRLAD